MTTLVATPLQVPAGTAAAPSIKFGAGATGLFRTGNSIGFTSKGVEVMRLNSTGAMTVTSAAATAFAVGLNGATTPALQVDASTATSITGVKIKSAATGGGVAISAIGEAANGSISFDAQGTGNINIGATSTGFTSVNRGKLAALVVGNTLTSIGTQNTTPTAAQLLGGVIEHASTTGAGTATLDTGTNIDTALPGVATGDTFTCVYANTGTQTVTITSPGASIVLKGTAAIPTLRNCLLTFRRTGAAQWTVYLGLLG
jgi:hypothetical protein